MVTIINVITDKGYQNRPRENQSKKKKLDSQKHIYVKLKKCLQYFIIFTFLTNFPIPRPQKNCS